LLSSYYQLKASLIDSEKNHALALAAVAGLLANANYEDGVFFSESFAGQLGTPKTKGGPPLMSSTRFRQLIKSRDWSEFYRRMRRSIRMIKGNANILSIADFVFQYDYEQRKEFNPEPSRRFQFRFAEDYFEASLKKSKKEAS
jgi:CRISPR system Cascade subunit CasB